MHEICQIKECCEGIAKIFPKIAVEYFACYYNGAHTLPVLCNKASQLSTGELLFMERTPAGLPNLAGTKAEPPAARRRRAAAFESPAETMVDYLTK